MRMDSEFCQNGEIMTNCGQKRGIKPCKNGVITCFFQLKAFKNVLMHKTKVENIEFLFKTMKSKKTFDFSTRTSYNIFKFIRESITKSCVHE